VQDARFPPNTPRQKIMFLKSASLATLSLAHASFARELNQLVILPMSLGKGAGTHQMLWHGCCNMSICLTLSRHSIHFPLT
jgi:hypothetical protein